MYVCMYVSKTCDVTPYVVVTQFNVTKLYSTFVGVVLLGVTFECFSDLTGKFSLHT
jgi:hypothetical protein